MDKIFSLLKPYWVWLLLAPLAMALEVSMDLMQPALMSRIIDTGIATGSQKAISEYGGKMLLCAFFGLIGGFGCTFFSSRAAQSFGNDLRRLLFHHIQKFSFSETDKFTTGSLVTRLTNDVQAMQYVVTMFTHMVIRSPLLLAGSVVLIVTTNSRIAIPLLLAAPVLSAIVVWKVRCVRPQFEQMQKRVDDVNSVMQENLTGIRVVKAFANEDDERTRFDEANLRLTETSIKTGRIMITLGPWLSVVQHATVIIIMFMAAHAIDLRLIQIGQVAAILNYATQVMMALVMLNFQMMHYSRAVVSAKRIQEVLDTAPSIINGHHTTSPAEGTIEFKAVSFKYPAASGVPALRNISLKIAHGESIAFMGVTGAGKTSLVNLIPRFYDATSGDVLVGGVPVRDYTLYALRRSIGIVMQNTTLFSGGIAENIRWGRHDATNAEVENVAKIAQAHDFITTFPEGYHTNVAQGGVTLSGGQRQRISIARALLGNPKILILDDSTSAVDVTTEAKIQDALRSVMADMTVIKIAQRISSVLDSDRIVLLDDGVIVAIGNHEELLRSSPEYREICDSQNAIGEADHAS